MKQYIEDFLKNWSQGNGVEIYNETAFQFELGGYLREKLKPGGYKVHFERDIMSLYGLSGLYKRNPDILIFKGNDPQVAEEKYAIELKYPMPSDGPTDKMFEMLMDIAFVHQLKANDFEGAYAITLTNRPEFYNNDSKEKAESIPKTPKRGDIFHTNSPKIVLSNPTKYYKTKKGTGRDIMVPSFTGSWETLYNDYRYYIIEGKGE